MRPRAATYLIDRYIQSRVQYVKQPLKLYDPEKKTHHYNNLNYDEKSHEYVDLYENKTIILTLIKKLR